MMITERVDNVLKSFQKSIMGGLDKANKVLSKGIQKGLRAFQKGANQGFKMVGMI